MLKMKYIQNVFSYSLGSIKMKKTILFILLSLITNELIAQNLEIDTISYGNYGGKRIYTNSYCFTNDSIIKEKKYTDYRKKTETISKVNTIEIWNNLLSKINILYFQTIENEVSQSASCGSDTYITLTFKNGKNVTIINAHNNKMWGEIQNELEILKNQIDKE